MRDVGIEADERDQSENETALQCRRWALFHINKEGITNNKHIKGRSRPR